MATTPRTSRRLPSWLTSSAARLLILTIGVAALVLAAILIPTLFTGDDDDKPVAGGAAWSRAYIYDGATGQGASINPDGSVIEAYNDMGRFVDARVIARSRSIAFIGEEAIDIGPIPADRSGPGVFNVPVPEGFRVAVLGVPDRLMLAVHSDDGGNLVLVDVDTRQVLDIGKLMNVTSPTFTLDDLQLEPTGTVFAIYEPELKKTAVLSFSKPTPTFLPVRGLAISNDRVLGTLEDGSLGVFEIGGRQLRSYDAGTIIGATMDGIDAYLITEDDQVLRLDDGADAPKHLAQVPDAKKIVIADNGDRLVVDSPWGFSFLSSDGDELGQLTPNADGVETPARHSECISAGITEFVTPGSTQDDPASGPSLITLSDLTVNPLPAFTLQTASPNGCTVAVGAANEEYFTLHSSDGSLGVGTEASAPTVGPYKRMFMSPDPNQWIAMTADGDVELIELVDGTATVIADIPFPKVDYITVAFSTP